MSKNKGHLEIRNTQKYDVLEKNHSLPPPPPYSLRAWEVNYRGRIPETRELCSLTIILWVYTNYKRVDFLLGP